MQNSLPLRLVALGLLLPSGSPVAQSVRPQQQLDVTTPSGDDLSGASIASSGGLSAAVYSDDIFFDSRVFVTTSDATGLAWSAPVQVDGDTSGAEKIAGESNNTPGVFVSGDRIYTLWIDERNGSTDDDLYFAHSADRGLTWSEQRLDKGVPGGGSTSVASYACAVTSDAQGDHVYIAIELNSFPSPIYLAASHDGGVTFDPTVPLSTLNGIADIDSFTLAADGLDVYVAFSDDRAGASASDDLWLRRSTDGGVSFGPAVQVDASGPLVGDLVQAPSLSVLGNRVAVAWLEELSDPTNEEVHVAVSIDGGASFLADRRVDTIDATLFDADDPEVRLCGADSVIVTWTDNRSGANVAQVRSSTDDGLSYGAELALGGVNASDSRLASDGAGLVVFATEAGSPNGIDSAWSADCGATFTPAFVASGPTTLRADDVQIALEDTLENVHLLWFAEDNLAYNAFTSGYSLCTGADQSIRSAGSNPASLTASEALLGEEFTASVDVGSTGHALAALVGYAAGTSLPLAGGRVLLVDPLDPNGELLGLAPQPGPVAGFAVTVPLDPALCGLPVSTQAVHLGGPPFLLSNAVDLTVRGR